MAVGGGRGHAVPSVGCRERKLEALLRGKGPCSTEGVGHVGKNDSSSLKREKQSCECMAWRLCSFMF